MIIWSQLSTSQQQQALARPALSQAQELTQQVADIIEQVNSQGDAALVALTNQFDGIKLAQLAITEEEISTACERLSTQRKAAIEQAYNNIYAFHQAQQPETITVETQSGICCELRNQALDSVGLYIPAGSAPLPSTVLMLGIPAQIAECPRVILVSPPDQNGNIADEVLYCAKRCGITEIYKLGGAQAIAAMALGSEIIQPVVKVFGPGNKYVTEAKKQLAQSTTGFTIDMPAGPSEVLVIADSKANPSFVAADLLSQAEHGTDSQVILLSDSKTLIDQVKAAISQQVNNLSRASIANQALEYARFILVDNIAQAVQVSNLYAPEHLIIQTEQAEQLVSSIRNAGSVFVGAYSPESAGDYASGTNHVLPTYGYANCYSSLSLADFMRRFTVQKLSKQGLANIENSIIELTNAEGLDAHQQAVTIRLADETINEVQ